MEAGGTVVVAVATPPCAAVEVARTLAVAVAAGCTSMPLAAVHGSAVARRRLAPSRVRAATSLAHMSVATTDPWQVATAETEPPAAPRGLIPIRMAAMHRAMQRTMRG